MAKRIESQNQKDRMNPIPDGKTQNPDGKIQMARKIQNFDGLIRIARKTRNPDGKIRNLMGRKSQNLMGRKNQNLRARMTRSLDDQPVTT